MKFGEIGLFDTRYRITLFMSCVMSYFREDKLKHHLLKGCIGLQIPVPTNGHDMSIDNVRSEQEAEIDDVEDK